MTTKDISGEQAYGSEIASSYEKDRQVEKLWHVEQAFMQKVVSNMAEGSKLLDIPVGTGRFLPYYASQKLNVLGVDISSSMLLEARAKVALSSIRLEVGDARALSADDNSVDYVVCWRFLHLLPADMLRSVTKELARVTSGTLYVQAYVKDPWYYALWLKMMVKAMFRKLGGRKRLMETSWSHIKSYSHEEAALLKVFKDCGLSVASKHVLGTYGLLRVKVYVLSKG